MTQKFSEGDKVRWTSSSNGTTTEKVGTVCAVIPQGRNVKGYLTAKWLTHVNKLGSYGSRDHWSYLIEVPHPGKGKPALYWPRVSALEVAE